MKLSELGQGKPKVRKYNYQGVNLLFVEPDREKFLEFTEVALSPLTDLTKAHERYKSEVKKQEADEKIAIEQGLEKPTNPELFKVMGELTKASIESARKILPHLRSFLPEVIAGWEGVTLEKYEEFFQTEYPDVKDKSILVGFDPPEQGYEMLYQKARHEDDFRTWLTDMIVNTMPKDKSAELETQKKI